jgi:rubrerythrin
MGLLFSGSELIDMAVERERGSMAYYGTLAELVEDGLTQNALKNLAATEAHHLAQLEKLRKLTTKFAPTSEEYNEDYKVYLKDLVDSAVFSNSEAARALARKAANKDEALQFAQWGEKDKLLLYQEIRGLIAPSERGLLEEIIGDEKSHLRDLTKMRGLLVTRQKPVGSIPVQRSD